MEQSPDERPFANAIPYADNSLSGSETLAASLANLVICDCAVTSITLHSPLSTHVEAGWSAIYVVRDGDCWLNGVGLDGSMSLHAGDTVLLPRGQQHWLSASDGPTCPQNSYNLWEDAVAKSKPVPGARRSPSLDSQILACRFRNHVGRISALLTALPTTIHIPAIELRSASPFESTITLMDEEATTLDPGSCHIVAHLVQILFMQVVRHLLPGGRLHGSVHESAFSDPIIGVSLGLINNHLRKPWTLASLAEAVGVSRSTFAARFSEKVGTPPLAYLWQRRMEHAVVMLSDYELGIKEIASRIGYKSESAFSTAFKRWSGMTPGAFRRERQI